MSAHALDPTDNPGWKTGLWITSAFVVPAAGDGGAFHASRDRRRYRASVMRVTMSEFYDRRPEVHLRLHEGNPGHSGGLRAKAGASDAEPAESAWVGTVIGAGGYAHGRLGFKLAGTHDHQH
jgi:hypothetical protein